MIRKEQPVSNGQGRVSALFIGKDAAFAAEPFAAQYDIISRYHRDIQSLIYVEQVHGDCVREVAGAGPGVVFAGEGDALWTRDTDTALLIRTADCVPILFYSKSQALVGAVHAGWRGLEARILTKAVERLAVKDLEFIVGPFIGGTSYEVGDDVAGRFAARCSTRGDNGKFLLDLRAVLEAEMDQLGIEPSQVTWFAEDTLKSGDWYSARAGDSRRNLALIWLSYQSSNMMR